MTEAKITYKLRERKMSTKATRKYFYVGTSLLRDKYADDIYIDSKEMRFDGRQHLRDSSKYMPHQGKKECERRKRDVFNPLWLPEA